jgi:hypothetical protein
MFTHNTVALAERISGAFGVDFAAALAELEAEFGEMDAPADFDSAAFSFDPFVV